jgi:hypothetical protein
MSHQHPAEFQVSLILWSFKKSTVGLECCSVVEYFPSMPEALGLIHSTKKKKKESCVLDV